MDSSTQSLVTTEEIDRMLYTGEHGGVDPLSIGPLLTHREVRGAYDQLRNQGGATTTIDVRARFLSFGGPINWLRDLATPANDNDGKFFQQCALIVAV
jgi:hypothetical protein